MAERIISANGYDFSVNTGTETITAAGKLQSVMAPRDAQVQIKAGGTERLSTDHGGHIISAAANGPAIPENLTAQDAHLNQGPFKSMENAEQRLLAHDASIQTERTAFVSGQHSPTGSRSDVYMVNDEITYADGQTQNVHLSFANLSVSEQENLNQALDAHTDMLHMLNPGDGLREELTPEEYAELMEETDHSLPNIKDEFIEQTYLSFPEIENGPQSFDVSFSANNEPSICDTDNGPSVNDTDDGPSVCDADDGASASLDD